MVRKVNVNVIREFKNNISKYIAIMILITVSITVALGLNKPLNIEKYNKERFFEKYNLEDGNFQTLSPIDEDYLQDTYNIKVERYEEVDKEYEGSTLRVFSLTNDIDKVQVVEGELPSEDDEILIDDSFKNAHSLIIGEKIEVSGDEYTITGSGYIPNYFVLIKTTNEIVPNSNDFGIAVVNSLNSGSKIYNYIYKDDDNRIDDARSYLKDKKLLKLTPIDNNLRLSLGDAKFDSITLIATVFPILVLVLSLIILLIILSRIIRLQKKEIGTLYALGYKSIEILKGKVFLILSISIVSTVVGAFASKIVSKVFYKILNSQFGMNIEFIPNQFKEYAVICGLPVIILTLATLILFLKVLKEKPIDLMNGRESTKNSVGKNINIRFKKFKNIVIIRDLIKNKSRAVIMILGVMIPTILLIYGGILMMSLRSTVVTGVSKCLLYEYNYEFNSIHIDDDKSYEDGQKYNVYQIEYMSTNIPVYGVEDGENYINLLDEKGNKYNTGNTIITKGLADKLKIKAGDKIEFNDILTGDDLEIYVDYVDSNCQIVAIYMPLEQLNNIMNLNENSYIGVFSKDKLDIDNNLLSKVEEKQDIINSYNDFLKPMMAMLSMLLIGSSVISIVCIYIVISISLEESKNSISLFKLLGYVKKEINTMFFKPLTILMLLGYVLALPVSFVMLKKILYKMSAKLPIELQLDFNIYILIAAFIIIVGSYFINLYLAKKKINNIEAGEILKNSRE
ncbi:FtsX-like permease family protein [uncultured Clostridium sp.]|uniref:ABC transporter permease n=1 Tax=uncultured Clostridium sp. TaxID=59620 RepID=UPI0025CD0C7F|nr:FtsX-like permease family protein [uncultured Clostridium sp.]